MFKKLENEMKPVKNYQLYRDRVSKLRKEGTPLLPYLGKWQPPTIQPYLGDKDGLCIVRNLTNLSFFHSRFDLEGHNLY